MMIKSNRIVPTSEEIEILKQKLSNIKDLNMFPPKNYLDPFIKRKPNAARKRGMNKSFNVPNDRELSLNDNSIRNNNQNITHITHKPIMNDELNSKSTNLEELLGLKQDTNSSSVFKKEIVNKMSQETVSFRNRKSIPTEDSNKVSNSKKAFRQTPTKQEYSQFIIDQEEEKRLSTKFQNNPTISEILRDYTKLKAESIVMRRIQEENDKHILNLEKENKFLKDLYNSVPINKSSLKYFVINILCNKINLSDTENKKILNDLFTNEFSKSKFDFIRFLNQRIDALELQNFHLISKIEKNNMSMKNYINELNEFYEVISDIRNVVNQVYESQTLTTEFLIIRDTLNHRINYLIDQKEINSIEKEKIENDETKNLNLDLLLCKDKIIESKVNMINASNNYGGTNSKLSALNSSTLSANNNNKVVELIDEKIEIYENMRNNIAQSEDNLRKNKGEGESFNLNSNLAENLMNENYILKTKNIRLIKYLSNLLKNKEFEMIDENLNELNELMNSYKDLLFSEDMFNIIKSQAAVIENILENS